MANQTKPKAAQTPRQRPGLANGHARHAATRRAKCKRYLDRGMRKRNSLRRMWKHARRHPNDLGVLAAIDYMEKLTGVEPPRGQRQATAQAVAQGIAAGRGGSM